MVRSVADGPMPPRAVAGPSLAQSLTMAMPVKDNEADEEDVESVPRLDRSAFGYLEPRPGIDGASYFGNCASCSNYLPEAMMRGALRGNRCGLFGSSFPITDDDGCDRFTPWPDGRPCADDLADLADDMVEGMRGSVVPYQVGYTPGKTMKCCTCEHFDSAESECEMFEELTTKLPSIFALDATVKPDARCNLWGEIMPEEPDYG